MECAKMECVGTDIYNTELITTGDIQGHNVYGGEMVALATKAALQTTPNPANTPTSTNTTTTNTTNPNTNKWLINSVHCYYTSIGKVGPISFHVTRIKDGHSYCFRSVTGIQYNKTIIVCLVSFQSTDDNNKLCLPHSSHSMPIVPGPNDAVHNEKISSIFNNFSGSSSFPIERRFCNPKVWEIKGNQGYHPTPMEPRHSIWIKQRRPIHSMDQNEHRLAMIFATDYAMPGLITRRYPSGCNNICLSIDHCVYFHDTDINFNNWYLFDQECTYSSSTTLNTARIYSKNGQQVATVVQQSLFFAKL